MIMGGLMRILQKAALPLLLLGLLCPALKAQDEDAQDYQKMVQQMMKSGNYEQKQEEEWDARLKVASGSVMLKPAHADEWSAVTGEVPLAPDDTVKTGPDGVADILLDDKGVVSLGRNTQFEVNTVEHGDTIFSLGFGSVVAKIKKFVSDKYRLQVRTPSAVCAVRGTEFAVEYSQMGKETGVAVFDEGRVAVTPQAEEGGEQAQEYTLEKNTELVFGPNNKRFRPVRLARMARHKGALGVTRSRLAALKGWKPRSAARREALRDQALKRRVIRRQIKKGGKARKAGKARSGRRSSGRRQAPPPEELGEPGE